MYFSQFVSKPNAILIHYENIPIQIFRKVHLQKTEKKKTTNKQTKKKKTDKKSDIFHISAQNRLCVLVRTASAILTSTHNLCFEQK